MKHFIVDETKVMRNDHVDVRKKIKDYDSPLEYSNFDLKVSNFRCFIHCDFTRALVQFVIVVYTLRHCDTFRNENGQCIYWILSKVYFVIACHTLGQ